MRVTGDWINAPSTQQVCAVLSGAGHQVYFVGGCVRNALMGVAVSDIDLATSALPAQVVDLVTAAGLKAIPTGIDHGTITAVAGGISHEITTFRNDVQTDGRHAIVGFSDNVLDDARRRDFTMNALYAAPDGTVLDPLNGLPDLQDRRVRFIEDPVQRIQEDYLRILRFFRFHAWYGDSAAGLDPEGLAAIASHLDGLAGLSKERIGSEIKKLLLAPDPAPAVAAMRATGVLNAVLQGADDKALAPLVHFEQAINAPPDAMRRLASLGVGDRTPKALRLSKRDTDILGVLREQTGTTTPAHVLGYRFGSDLARGVMLLRAAMLELPLQSNLQQDIALGANAVFPLRAADLMPELSGPALGRRLAALEQQWVESRFTLTRQELLG